MAMNMRRRLVATVWGAFGLLLAGSSAPVRAQSSLHDIPWYMAHDAARAATTKLCQSDHRFAHDVDCANAETAETKLWGQRSAKFAFGDMTSPQYWAANRLQRSGILSGCNRPVPTYDPSICAAARQGDAIAGRGGRP